MHRLLRSTSRRSVRAIIAGFVRVACLLSLADLADAGGKSTAVIPPEVEASVNDSLAAEVHRGWPLLLTVGIYPPDTGGAKTKPVWIAASTGNWSNAIELRVLDEAAQPQAWPLHLANAPTNALAVGAKAKLPKGVPKDKGARTAGRLHWYLTTEETAQLTEGVYEIHCALQSTNSAYAKAWSGSVEAPTVLLTVSAEPQPLSVEKESLKARLEAQLDVIQGNRTGALDRINQFLALHTNDVSGQAVRAALLDSLGQTNDAINAYNLAIQQFRAQNPNAAEPPRELTARHRELLNALLTAR